ncbi:sensor histidine kinase [Actinoplanes teichomyceticus]|uniref:sensor histidine kinase n=1 Tax=Actinoplanes teichomyceticus TaxID=1867 RepID=UPI0013DE6765|nr:ATP-binding protein [Actinoplanes teichomyceticus]GIF17006.1 hypothetical protein Ate01nite_70380 [Actinoplanes teichomyceticus]
MTCGEAGLHEVPAVLTAALEAYFAFDRHGRVLAWNPAAETTFGYTHAQACGRQIEDLIVRPQSRPAGRAELAALAAGQSGHSLGRRLQWFVRHADGHEFPVEMTLTSTDEPTGRIFHAFAHDVTSAHRASRFAAVETAVARGLAEAASSDTAGAHVVTALGAHLDWPVVELWLVDEQRQLLTCAARYARSGLRLGDFVLDELECGTGLPGRVCAEATTCWVSDLQTSPGYLRARAAGRIGLHVAIGVPLCNGVHTLGALCVFGDRVEEPEETLLSLLGGLAAQLGQYLERRRAEELAIELARTKDEFLAMVTHELRNPVATIAAAATLLQEELAELNLEQPLRSLQAITRNAERLSVMAEDLLDLARLESGHLAIQPTDTDLAAIIGQAVENAGPAAQAKQLTLTVRLPRRLDLHGDPVRLRQVADNLLGNAIKYTPAGGAVTVTAGLDDTGQTVTWTVADTGIGIPAAERPRLFRRFYRASTALQQRIPGTGLGLVISRTIIERHRGTIALADHTGPGTTFLVRLPATT